MSKKKKRIIIIIIIAVLLICIAVAVVFSSRNSGKKQENQLSGSGDVSTEETAGVDNSQNESSVSGSTEEQGYAEATTEEAEQPIAEFGSTADDNKPTGGTSDSTTSQPITTQTPTTQTPTTQTPTTQTPNTTEQPSGGNQGGGNGGNTHQHTWEAQYRTVHHDEVGHYENVCVKEAYDEPVYEGHYVCNYCSKDITSSGEGPDHCIVCGPPLSEDDIRYVPGIITTAGSSYGTIRVQVGTTHHEAVYEKKWIVDKKSYDEQIQNGYKCTTCGAVKDN